MSQMKPPDIRLQEDLERRIVHGIASEWENALWILSPDERQRMQQPLFGLRTTKSRLGYWSGEKNEITISRTFALDYPWDDVRDVILERVRQGETAAGLIAGVERAGALLREHFPAEDSDPDQLHNELRVI